MKTEKGVTIVAYKESNRNKRFLVLQRTKNWDGWELPKGHLENDDHRETVELELEEEAGISEESIESLESLEQVMEWTFERDGDEIKREYSCYIVKVNEDAIVDTTNNPHDEHEGGYFFDLTDAKALLTYDNQRELLEEVAENL
ncbi:MAG: 8-oxo-dGTP pyrophosphatase MutT (NUDIX family) [Colwellia polaris]